ncbi:MAG TPA: metalloregulator ArsR/SmtB family transcription factor [Gemmatimonadales bacterium]|nr:metalloregulator ArsR/SmtB family transcription factor [Gemmatimonadales bacterium]
MRRSILLRIAHTWPRERPGLPHLPHALDPQLARVAQWFHAASDTTRLGILEFLSQRDRSVSELLEFLGVPPSRVSFHLKVLMQSGLIRGYRDGRHRFYSLRGETLDLMLAFMRTIMPGAHQGTCPLSCCRQPLTYQENLIR